MLHFFARIVCQAIHLPRYRRAERGVGYKIEFTYLPDQWLQSVMRCDMTATWKAFGLGILHGTNHFTVGAICNGKSERFNKTADSYQSWIGGYVVRLSNDRKWEIQDHLNLAVADQMSWLGKWYGDPSPLCIMKASEFKRLKSITIDGYNAELYTGSCITHSDVGSSPASLKLRIASAVMSEMFNLFDKEGDVPSQALVPESKRNAYEKLELKGFIAIVEVEANTKVVLYSNGVTTKYGHEKNTFTQNKAELLSAISSCRIVPA